MEGIFVTNRLFLEIMPVYNLNITNQTANKK